MFKQGDHWTVRLDHILQVIGESHIIMKGLSYDDFKTAIAAQRSLERIVEIISEASKHIPDDIKTEFPYAWKEIVGMRNIISHEYAGVDYQSLWDTYHNDFPGLENLMTDIQTKYEDI